MRLSCILLLTGFLQGTDIRGSKLLISGYEPGSSVWLAECKYGMASWGNDISVITAAAAFCIVWDPEGLFVVLFTTNVAIDQFITISVY